MSHGDSPGPAPAGGSDPICAPRRTLSAAASAHGVELPDSMRPQIEKYCELLWDWNRKLNLTRHTDYDKFVSRDLVDSIQLAQLLSPGERVLDVGSGGGVPGIVLAILRPDLCMSLCESIGKKAGVLQAMVEALGLRASVYNRRAEDVLTEQRFQVLTARAVGPLWKMLKWFRPHWPSIGRFLVIKGPHWVDERAEARHRGMLQNIQLRRVAEYTTPGSQAQNVILQLWSAGRTDEDADSLT